MVIDWYNDISQWWLIYGDKIMSNEVMQEEVGAPQTQDMNFGQALEWLKQGQKVARIGWNDRGMWLLLVPGSNGIRPVAGTPYSNAGLTEKVNINPHIDMFTASGEMQPGWLASQTDMLADDWCVIE